MYKDFHVRRSRADDWARYPAPARIAVRYEPTGTEPLGLEPAVDFQTAVAARLAGESGQGLRHSLSRYLRECFTAKHEPGRSARANSP